MKSSMLIAGVALTAVVTSFVPSVMTAQPKTTVKPDSAFPLTVTGPAEVEPGDLVELTAQGEYYTDEKGIAAIQWQLINSEKNFALSDFQNRIFTSFGKAGTYTFTVSAAKENRVATALFVVTVGKPNPEPDPEPDPDPVPPPDPRPEGIAGEAYDLAVAAKRPADCVGIARAFNAVISAIGGGGVTDTDAAAAMLGSGMKALNLNRASWEPFALWYVSKLKTAAGSDLAKAMAVLKLIAIGVEAAGKAK